MCAPWLAVFDVIQTVEPARSILTVDAAGKVHGQHVIRSFVHWLASDVESQQLTLNIFCDVLDKEALLWCPVVQFDGFEVYTPVNIFNTM